MRVPTLLAGLILATAAADSRGQGQGAVYEDADAAIQSKQFPDDLRDTFRALGGKYAASTDPVWKAIADQVNLAAADVKVEEGPKLAWSIPAAKGVTLTPADQDSLRLKLNPVIKTALSGAPPYQKGKPVADKKVLLPEGPKTDFLANGSEIRFVEPSAVPPPPQGKTFTPATLPPEAVEQVLRAYYDSDFDPTIRTALNTRIRPLQGPIRYAFAAAEPTWLTWTVPETARFVPAEKPQVEGHLRALLKTVLSGRPYTAGGEMYVSLLSPEDAAAVLAHTQIVIEPGAGGGAAAASGGTTSGAAITPAPVVWASPWGWYWAGYRWYGWPGWYGYAPTWAYRDPIASRWAYWPVYGWYYPYPGGWYYPYAWGWYYPYAWNWYYPYPWGGYYPYGWAGWYYPRMIVAAGTGAPEATASAAVPTPMALGSPRPAGDRTGEEVPVGTSTAGRVEKIPTAGLGPAEGVRFYDAGYQLYWANKPAEALANLTAATELLPGDARSWYYRALAERALGDEAAARASVEKGTAAEARQPTQDADVAEALRRLPGSARALIDTARDGRLR